MENEKALLLPRSEVVESAPRPQCCAWMKNVLKVLGTTAAAGIIYYSVPEGNASFSPGTGTKLTSLQSFVLHIQVGAVFDSSMRPRSFRDFIQSIA